MRYRVVLKFEKEGVSYTTAESVIIMSLRFVLNRRQKPLGIHIADLTELYAVIVEHIMQKETIPSGEKGYYLAMSHQVPCWRTMDLRAQHMHQRGLVNEPYTSYMALV